MSKSNELKPMASLSRESQALKASILQRLKAHDAAVQSAGDVAFDQKAETTKE